MLAKQIKRRTGSNLNQEEEVNQINKKSGKKEKKGEKNVENRSMTYIWFDILKLKNVFHNL